jgi:hypothetical protein
MSEFDLSTEYESKVATGSEAWYSKIILYFLVRFICYDKGPPTIIVKISGFALATTPL